MDKKRLKNVGDAELIKLLDGVGKTMEPADPALANKIMQQIPENLHRQRTLKDTANVVLQLNVGKLTAAAAIVISVGLFFGIFGGRQFAGDMWTGGKVTAGKYLAEAEQAARGIISPTAAKHARLKRAQPKPVQETVVKEPAVEEKQPLKAEQTITPSEAEMKGMVASVPTRQITEEPAGRPLSEIQEEQKAVAEINERIVLKALYSFAEFTNGRYPSEISMSVMIKELRKAGMVPVNGQNGAKTDLIKELKLLCSVYEQLQREAKDVAYYGDTVIVGEPAAVLMRWRLTDGRYVVIFGNLDKEIVRADKLALLEASQ